MARRSKAKGRVVSLDFTDVEPGGGSFRIKEGQYRMVVGKVEDTESDKGNSMFKWTFIGKEGAAKNKKFYLYTVYDPPDSLWKLRSLLEALGQEIPEGPLDLDLDEMIDLELIGHVEDEEYNDKMTSKLKDFSSVDGTAEEEEEEEKPKKGKKKSKKKDEEEEEESEEESEEEEDEKPKKDKKGKKGKKLDAVSAEEVKALDEEEMTELVERYELEVDLDDHKTLRRKASAIIAALEEKELLSDD